MMSETQTFAYLVADSTDGVRYPLIDREVLLGRGTTCQVQLNDPKVSRQHARIKIGESTAIIEDLESSHGTLVNGQRILSAELVQGDLITLGDTGLRFEVAPDSVATKMVEVAEADLTTNCPQCGEQVSINQNFCPECGSALKEKAEKRAERELVGPAPVAIPQTPVSTPVQPPVEQVIPEPRRRHGLMFVLGFAIPLVLGLIGVVTLIALGIFDEPELSLPLDQEESIIIAPSPDESSSDEFGTDEEISPTPTSDSSTAQDEEPYIVRAYESATDAGLPVQSALAVYDDIQEEGGYLYMIPLSTGQDIVIDYFYCGTSESLLDEISNSISVQFEVDGVPVPDESLDVEKSIMPTRACTIVRGVFSGLMAGEYTLVQTMSVTDQIYDGWETWGPEELVSKILIQVGEKGS